MWKEICDFDKLMYNKNENEIIKQIFCFAMRMVKQIVLFPLLIMFSFV